MSQILHFRKSAYQWVPFSQSIMTQGSFSSVKLHRSPTQSFFQFFIDCDNNPMLASPMNHAPFATKEVFQIFQEIIGCNGKAFFCWISVAFKDKDALSKSNYKCHQCSPNSPHNISKMFLSEVELFQHQRDKGYFPGIKPLLKAILKQYSRHG